MRRRRREFAYQFDVRHPVTIFKNVSWDIKRRKRCFICIIFGSGYCLFEFQLLCKFNNK